MTSSMCLTMDGTSAPDEARTSEAGAVETASAAATKPARKARHTYCSAPNCACSKTRHRQEHDGRRCSLFGMPRDELMFRRWQRHMPPRPGGKRLTPQSALCERHFDPQFVLRYYEHTVNGEVVRIMRGKPSLTPDAVPTMFPDSPSYYTRHVPRRRKPVQRVSLPPPKRKRTSATTSPAKTSSADGPAAGEASEVQPAVVEVPATGDADQQVVVECEVTPAFPYKDLPLPSSRWARHVISEKPLVIAYSTCRVSDDEPGRLITEKLVLVREHEDHAECHAYLDGRLLPSFEGAGGTDWPCTLLQRLDSVQRCPGLEPPEEFHLAEDLPPYVEMRESRLHSVQCCGAATTRAGLSAKCQHAKSLLCKRRARLERKIRMRDRPPVREVVTSTEPPSSVKPADLTSAPRGKNVEGEFKPSVEDDAVSVELVIEEFEDGSLETGLGESESPPVIQHEMAVPYRVVISGQGPIYVQ